MPPLSFTVRDLLYMGILFLACLLSAQVFAHFYTTIPTAPAFIWPAAGIALAGLILGGAALWPAIALAAFVHQLLLGTPLIAAFALSIANVLQALLGYAFLRRAGFTNSFSRVRHTVAFIIVTVVVSLIVPTLGTLTFLALGEPLPRGIAGTFVPWWFGHMLSLLIVTPLLIRWLPRFSFRRTRIELLEAVLALVSLVASGIVLYWTPYQEIAEIPLIYLILIPFLWIALRIGPRFMTLAIFLNALLALGGTAYRVLDAGDPATLGYALLQTEVFVVMISYIFLLLVTVAEERKDTANDLRENVRRLEDAVERIRREDEAKSRFIATLAHELRNPLAPLLSSLDIMRLERHGDARTGALVEEMREHLGTMRHLLDDLLDISRISKEKLSLRKERVDLLGIIERSVRSTRSLLEEREHTLVLDLPTEAVLLEADPVRLEQVFVNLLNNAAKYTEPGGEITVRVTATADEAIVSVRDTGIGMDETLLEHVFEPFFQIEQPGKLKAGLGIGLSLTKNLVAMHDGTIEARSAGAHRGSEFVVRVPLHPEAARTASASAQVQAPQNGAGLSILVVDDNRAAADALAKLLSLRGHAVHTAYTGAEAIAKAPTLPLDVVLLDIGLPDMEGYEVARALKANDAVSAVLVALTGYGQESDIRKAERAGFSHHLTKPAGLAEIEEILATIAR